MNNIWKSAKQHRPTKSGWYYVTNFDHSISSRYYDDSDGVWYHATASDGFTPNDSFIEWLWVEEVHS